MTSQIRSYVEYLTARRALLSGVQCTDDEFYEPFNIAREALYIIESTASIQDGPKK